MRMNVANADAHHARIQHTKQTKAMPHENTGRGVLFFLMWFIPLDCKVTEQWTNYGLLTNATEA